MRNLLHIVLIIISLVVITLFSHGQILTSNGAIVQINSGAVIACNGGATLTNTTQLMNNGQVRITKNATLPLAGTFSILSSTTVGGNGTYWVEQDWMNDATFNAGTSIVQLYGNTQQFISSSNGTTTEFNELILTGNGGGNDQKKTLINADARISSTGRLILNNRQLETLDNVVTVLNPAPSSITNSQTFGSEGFVSSDNLGYLIWNTLSTNQYLFPVGSSFGTLRYRPIIIRPSSSAANQFAVRLNNVNADVYGYLLAQRDPEINSANDLFFHSIEQINGSSDADIEIAYLPSTDGDWSSMAHWEVNQSLWNTMGETEVSAFGNYSSVQKLGWNFPDVYHPYVLTTIAEDLIIPNVFTPNQDGINDTYYVTGKGINEFNMVIMNRWGDVVFETDNLQTSWDGTTHGEPCANGTYFYIITAKSSTKEYKKQGHITINGSL